MILIGVILLLNSCSSDPFKIDITGIDYQPEIKAFYLKQINPDTSNAEQFAFEAAGEYPEFWDIYTHKIIMLGGMEQTGFISELDLFLHDPQYNEVCKRVEKHYADFNPFRQELSNAFKHVAYYYPNKKLPDIIPYIGNFNQSVVVGNNFIGLALEKYSNIESEFLSSIGIPVYLHSKMKSKYLAEDAIKAYAKTEFLFGDSLNDLISNMIYEGKIIYFLQAMLPGREKAFYHQYSEKQMKWCDQYERKMWRYMVDNKLLFNSDHKMVLRFIYDGPFTAAFGNDSPARTGIYLGWKIVSKYMNENPGVSLQQLMENNDYHHILNLSKYNP